MVRLLERRGWEIALLLAVACVASAGRAEDKPDFSPTIERSLFDSLNQERTNAGLAPLKWNDKLMESARAHAQRMAAVHMLTHQVAEEPVLTKRVAETGLRFNATAENIAFAYEPEDIHPGWMHSAGHRKNILNPNYNSVGIGVLKVGGVFYAVQNFAHVTSEDNVPKAEDRLAGAFNKKRETQGMAAVRIVPTAALHDAVCSMARSDKLQASVLPAGSGQHSTIAFTASEPEEMPQNLLALANDSNLKTLYVGACYMATAHYPGGTYWFGVVY